MPIVLTSDRVKRYFPAEDSGIAATSRISTRMAWLSRCLYLADRILNLLLPRLAVAGSGHNRQDHFIRRGLMELESQDSVTSVHQVGEELSMNDATIWHHEVVAGARDFQPHERKMIAAGTSLLRDSLRTSCKR